MLLQPLAENAIEHGIFAQPAKGEITISFKIIAAQMVIILEDNGIGITQAQRLARKEKHRSSAIEITRNRLKLLEGQTGQRTELQIADLKDNNAETQGTRVVLKIPLLVNY